MNHNNICYVYDEELIKQADRLPAVSSRASLVHALIEAYRLISSLKVVRSVAATLEELETFHSSSYLNHLKSIEDIDDDEYNITSLDEKYGLGYDCEPVSRMFNLVSVVAGGSITAAKCLIQGVGHVAINWCGGWHHASRLGAEGFCYVNDCVLAIEQLKTKFNKILYLDLDIHHGNGVQDAYALSQSVFTLSIHKYEPGFYPGTGSIDDIGKLNGKGYKANVPLKGYYGDEIFKYAFQKVFTMVMMNFKANAIVVQCGADALARDPHGGASLTEDAYLHAIDLVLNEHKPTLLLGGGGYNLTNAARLWTSITALVAGVSLDKMIPEHEYWPRYRSNYTLHIEKPLARDTNDKNYVNQLLEIIQGNMFNPKETCEPEVGRKTIGTGTLQLFKQVKDKEKNKDNPKDVYEFQDT